MNKVLIVALGTAMLALPANAQQAPAAATTAQQWVEIDNDSLPVGDWQITVDQVEDLNVTLADGTRVGEVDEVIGLDAGTPAAVVVDVDDFGGLDDAHVIFPLEELAVAQGALFTELTAEDIAALPRWND